MHLFLSVCLNVNTLEKISSVYLLSQTKKKRKKEKSMVPEAALWGLKRYMFRANKEQVCANIREHNLSWLLLLK